MADIIVHASRRGRILCGAKADHLQAFYAMPVHRGTEKVTCSECLANVAQRCPICREETAAGIETNYICDRCWPGATVKFSMAAGNEAMANFPEVMEVASLAANVARMPLERALRRERAMRCWQAVQSWVLLLSCADPAPFSAERMCRDWWHRAGLPFDVDKTAYEAQRQRTLRLGDGSQ